MCDVRLNKKVGRWERKTGIYNMAGLNIGSTENENDMRTQRRMRKH
jgi:hypothetical protein